MKDINATVIIDLTLPLEEIKKNLEKDARWGIGKAEREGLIVYPSEDNGDWMKFYEIYINTMKDGGTNASSLETLKKNTRIFFVCKKEGKIIAGAGIWFVDKYKSEIPRLYFNSSLKEYQSFQPNNLLYWKCICWAKENGYNQFDLGGWQINAKGHLEGVNKFKEKWGKVVYYEKNYPLRIAIGRKLVRKFVFFKWLNYKLR